MSFEPTFIEQQLAAEALEWVGTRVRKQGRIKQVGVDCKGLIAGVLKACRRPEGDSVEALAGDYGAVVDERRLRAGLTRHFDKIDESHPGCVLLLRYDGRAQHLAWAVAGGDMVHAMFTGPRQVVRVPLTVDRLVSIWRLRDLG